MDGDFKDAKFHPPDICGRISAYLLTGSDSWDTAVPQIVTPGHTVWHQYFRGEPHALSIWPRKFRLELWHHKSPAADFPKSSPQNILSWHLNSTYSFAN